MHFTQAQQALFVSIQAHRGALPHFDVLCAHLEAALDQVLDTDKTPPFGVAAIVSTNVEQGVKVLDAATVIAVAWLDAIAEAINDQDGDINPLLFDVEGVPVFSDTRPLFEIAAACGYAPGQARLAFARVRKDEVVPRRALKILGMLHAIRPRKRKEREPRKSRVVLLSEAFVHGLERDEIARAKAGSLVYSLVARKDGYEAVRVRRKKARQMLDAAGAPIDVVSESDADVMDGFSVPLVPCEELHGTALDHFVQFLDEENERKSRNTYQRLVHRARAA